MQDRARNKIQRTELAMVTKGNVLMPLAPVVEAKMNKIINSAWWKRRNRSIGIIKVRVGGAAYCAMNPFGSSWEYLYKPANTELDYMHAFAHVLSGDHGHSPAFVKSYLEIVGHLKGVDFKKEFKAALIAAGVKTKTVSAETRAKQRENWYTRSIPGTRENLEEILKKLEGMPDHGV